MAVAPPLHDELQASLGDAYVLGRELGGGGMARVFVAEEVAFGRSVVVKVLPRPSVEVTGTSTLSLAEVMKADVVTGTTDPPS